MGCVGCGNRGEATAMGRQDRENKKKKLFGKRREKVTVGEDDIYFGLQLGQVEELQARRREELNREGYTGGPLEVSSPTATFAHLFEDHEPATGPEFEEKFCRLHQQRQERVKSAAQEAGAELEDVFSLYDQEREVRPRAQDWSMPEFEAPEKIVEELVSNTFGKIRLDADEEPTREELSRQLMQQEEQAEQENAALRQMIDDVLAKETVVDVDAPLDTESIFGEVARARTQDTVEAELEQERAAELEEATEVSVEGPEVAAEADAEVAAGSEESDDLDAPSFVSGDAAVAAEVGAGAAAGSEESDDLDAPSFVSGDAAVAAEVGAGAAAGSEESEDLDVPSFVSGEAAVAAEAGAEAEVGSEESEDLDVPSFVSGDAAVVVEADAEAEDGSEESDDLDVPSFVSGDAAVAAVADAEVEVGSEESEDLDVPSFVSGDAAVAAEAGAEVAAAEMESSSEGWVDVPDIAVHAKPVSYVFRKRPVRSLELEDVDAMVLEAAQGFAQGLHSRRKSEEPEPDQTALQEPSEVTGQAEAAPETPVAESVPRPEKQREKINLFTDVEEEDEPFEPEEELPELEDYTAQEDVRSVAGELGKNIRTLLLRGMITAICTMVLLVFGFVTEYHLFGAQVPVLVYAVTALVFLLIGMAACATTLLNGLKGLVRLRANADSAIAAASVVILIQSVVLLFMQSELETGSVHLYSCLVTGGLLLNTLGKLTLVRRIRQNFRFVAASGEKHTVELVENAEIAAQLAKDCVAGQPVVAYQKRTGFFSHFLRNSYAQDCSEMTSQILAPLGFISSLVLFIVSMVISRNVGTGFTAFAAAMCICVPMANMLCVHLPVSRLCKLARENGGMLVGYEAVEKFSEVNAVMIDAADLFPRGAVEIKGIQTFGAQKIDRVLLDAAALMEQVGGPLSEVFTEVVQSRENVTPHVENIAYEDEAGIVGWVSGRRILIGNRTLLRHYNVPAPDVETDAGTGQTVYIAAGNEVVGALVLSYFVSGRKKQEMQRMTRNGIGMVVKTTDPCVTAEFIAEQFEIDIHAITVLAGPLVHTYQELTGKTEQESEAMLATREKATCMMRVITACVRERSNIALVRLLQNVSVILGFVLVAFLVCFSGLAQIGTLAMVIYQAFWVLILLLLPKLRRS